MNRSPISDWINEMPLDPEAYAFRRLQRTPMTPDLRPQSSSTVYYTPGTSPELRTRPSSRAFGSPGINRRDVMRQLRTPVSELSFMPTPPPLALDRNLISGLEEIKNELRLNQTSVTERENLILERVNYLQRQVSSLIPVNKEGTACLTMQRVARRWLACREIVRRQLARSTRVRRLPVASPLSVDDVPPLFHLETAISQLSGRETHSRYYIDGLERHTRASLTNVLELFNEFVHERKSLLLWCLSGLASMKEGQMQDLCVLASEVMQRAARVMSAKMKVANCRMALEQELVVKTNRERGLEISMWSPVESFYTARDCSGNECLRPTRVFTSPVLSARDPSTCVLFRPPRALISSRSRSLDKGAPHDSAIVVQEALIKLEQPLTARCDSSESVVSSVCEMHEKGRTDSKADSISQQGEQAEQEEPMGPPSEILATQAAPSQPSSQVVSQTLISGESTEELQEVQEALRCSSTGAGIQATEVPQKAPYLQPALDLPSIYQASQVAPDQASSPEPACQPALPAPMPELNVQSSVMTTVVALAASVPAPDASSSAAAVPSDPSVPAPCPTVPVPDPTLTTSTSTPVALAPVLDSAKTANPSTVEVTQLQNNDPQPRSSQKTAPVPENQTDLSRCLELHTPNMLTDAVLSPAIDTEHSSESARSLAATVVTEQSHVESSLVPSLRIDGSSSAATTWHGTSCVASRFTTSLTAGSALVFDSMPSPSMGGLSDDLQGLTLTERNALDVLSINSPVMPVVTKENLPRKHQREYSGSVDVTASSCSCRSSLTSLTGVMVGSRDESETENSRTTHRKVTLPNGVVMEKEGQWRVEKPPSQAILVIIGSFGILSLFLGTVMLTQLEVSMVVISPFIVMFLVALLMMYRMGWGLVLSFSDVHESMMCFNVHCVLPIHTRHVSVPYDCLEVTPIVRHTMNGDLYVVTLNLDSALILPPCSPYEGLAICESSDQRHTELWENFLLARIEPIDNT